MMAYLVGRRTKELVIGWAYWREVEATGSPSFRRAAARQVKVCEAMLAVVEDD